MTTPNAFNWTWSIATTSPPAINCSRVIPRFVVLVCTVLALFTTPAAAQGMGKIVFTSHRDGNEEVYIVSPDGGGVRNLSNAPGSDNDAKLSPDGSRVTFTSNRSGNSDVYVVNVDGSGLRNLTNDPSADTSGAWSADGSKILFTSNRSGNPDIYVMNLDGSGLTNLTNHPATDFGGAFSPDGSHIAFVSNRDPGHGDWSIYMMNADGSGVTGDLYQNGVNDYDPSWSPDGSRIAFWSGTGNSHEILLMNPDGSGVINLTNHGADDGHPSYSPDGTRLAFSSNRNGSYGICVMAGTGGAVSCLLEPGVNHSPDWGVDGIVVPPQTDPAGKTVHLRIEVTDPDGDPLTFSASGLPPNLSIDPATGVISGTLAHNSAGAYQVTVTISDGGTSTMVSFPWTVSDLNSPPALGPLPVLPPEEGSVVDARFTASDPEGDGVTFSATGLPPGVTMDPSGHITGTLSYESAGVYGVTLRVTDGKVSETVSVLWTIIDRNRAPIAVNPGPQFNSEGDTLSASVRPAPSLPTTCPDALRVIPTGLSWGFVPVGTSSEQQTTLYNNSDCALSVSVSAPAGFEIASASSLNLDPNGSEVVKVRFAPQAQNNFDGFIVFKYSEGEVRLHVSGMGSLRRAPILSKITPNSVFEGDTVDITIEGLHFFADAALRLSWPGVTASDVVVVSSSRLKATLTIPDDVPVGQIDIRVTGGAAGDSNPLPFVIHDQVLRCTLRLESNPVGGGSVRGGGDVRCGTSVDIQAEANSGFTFVNWTKENGDEYSSSSLATVTVATDITLTANFGARQCVLSLTADPPEGGTVSGAGSATCNSNQVISAQPNTGFAFVTWTEGGAVVSTVAQTSILVDRNRNVFARFVPESAAHLGSGSVVYEGISPVTAMTGFSGGVLTAFSNASGNAALHRVHRSSDGNNVGSGPIVYEGISPVTAMTSYSGEVLTAFSNASGNPSFHRVHRSSDGNSVGSGPIVYEGISPVTAIASYSGGVLAAFSNAAGNFNLHRVHRSPDGNNLGSGAIVYEGVSPVTAMTAYRGGVLTAFSNASGNPNLHRVHWSPDGTSLGGGPIVYEGVSPVTAIIAHEGGVLTAFRNASGNPGLHRIHWSSDGTNLGGGPIVYEGVSPISAMTAYAGTVLSAFSNASGNPGLHRVHRSNAGAAAGVPPAPANLLASSPEPGQVRLTWNDTPNETRFEIRHQSNPSVATPGQNATTWLLTSLTLGESYHWDIRACNASGCSPWHGVVGKTPDGTP